MASASFEVANGSNSSSSQCYLNLPNAGGLRQNERRGEKTLATVRVFLDELPTTTAGGQVRGARPQTEGTEHTGQSSVITKLLVVVAVRTHTAHITAHDDEEMVLVAMVVTTIVVVPVPECTVLLLLLLTQ